MPAIGGTLSGRCPERLIRRRKRRGTHVEDRRCPFARRLARLPVRRPRRLLLPRSADLAPRHASAPRSISAIRSSRQRTPPPGSRAASPSISRASSRGGLASRSSSSRSRRAGQVVEAFKTGTIDVGFVAIDPERAADISYTAPYVIIEGAYLVAGRFADPQQRRRRSRGNAGGGRRAQRLRPLPVARAETSDARPRTDVARSRLTSSSPRKLDVAAGVKQQLEADAKRLPGLRLLDGRFMVINQAMGTPRGRTAGARYLTRFRRDDEVLRICRAGSGAARHRGCGGRAVSVWRLGAHAASVTARRFRDARRTITARCAYPARARHRHRVRRRASGLAGARRGAQRHGRHEPASRDQGRRRHPEAGRQRRRRRGRRRLRARRRLPRRRQPRRRRLHDDPARRRAQDVHRFPRNRPARRDAPTCTSTATATSSGAEHQRLSRGRRARQRRGIRAGARQIRHDEARRGHGAGHPSRASAGSCWSKATSTCSPSPTRDFREDAPSAAVFLRNGQPYVAGTTSRPEGSRPHARSHREARERRVLSRPVADAIVAASARGRGIITKEDLARYRAKERAPIECDYRGYRIVSAPPPSSGGVILCEILGVLEGYPLEEWGFRSARAVHYQIEAMRHAYVDRNSYLGDPDFVRNPVERLLDKKLRRADPRRHRSRQSRRVARLEARRRAARRRPTRRTIRSSTRTAMPSRSRTR